MSLLKYPFSFKQLKNYYRTSTHAPVKGATFLPFTQYIICFYFNPRSCEGSDSGANTSAFFIFCISIHAPAKGATVVLAKDSVNIVISIHAPAKGATV